MRTTRRRPGPAVITALCFALATPFASAQEPAEEGAGELNIWGQSKNFLNIWGQSKNFLGHVFLH